MQEPEHLLLRLNEKSTITLQSASGKGGEEDKVIVLLILFYVQSLDMETFLKKWQVGSVGEELFIHY